MLVASFGLSLVALSLTEVIPAANERSAEVLGKDRSEGARLSFVYRGDGGRYYTIRRLTTSRGEIERIRIDREGGGYDYPRYSVDAATATGTAPRRTGCCTTAPCGCCRSAGGRSRFGSTSSHQAEFAETPEDLLAPPKDVENMDYGELEEYIDALDRSGSDTRQLRVELMLKIAFPFACFIIALFGAPLANSSRRGGASISIGIALVTTLLFLSLIRIAEGLGAGGILPAGRRRLAAERLLPRRGDLLLPPRGDVTARIDWAEPRPADAPAETAADLEAAALAAVEGGVAARPYLPRRRPRHPSQEPGRSGHRGGPRGERRDPRACCGHAGPTTRCAARSRRLPPASPRRAGSGSSTRWTARRSSSPATASSPMMVGLAVDGAARLGAVLKPDPGRLYLGLASGGAWVADVHWAGENEGVGRGRRGERSGRSCRFVFPSSTRPRCGWFVRAPIPTR